MSNAKQELRDIQQGRDMWGPVLPKPSLAMRSKLAQFALENDLEDEGEALLVVAARYLRMAESDRWAAWLAGPSEQTGEGDQP